MLQEAVPTVKALQGMIGREEIKDGVHLKWSRGLLYCVMVPLGKDGDIQAQEHLVLPTKCCGVSKHLSLYHTPTKNYTQKMNNDINHVSVF